MAEAAPGRVALFSIHPFYAEALLSGTKRVEFRRTALPVDVARIVVYATAPLKHVIGYFEVSGVEQKSPSTAWKRYGRVGGISKVAFDRYYTGAAHAYVIHADNPVRLSKPIRLTDLCENIRPPQSFMYMREDIQARFAVLSEDGSRCTG